MKPFFFFGLSILSISIISQTTGTIQVEKEQIKERYSVQFSGQENGPLILKDYLVDKCLLNNKGLITSFQVVIEDNTADWRLLSNQGGCLTATNYQVLEQLASGSNIEFINILGLNDSGNKIIFPGMKFVIKK
ncbi:hypothetical protein OAW23_03600 [Flavobacteriales bacterium]|jgi:hypothetical protein|nr:hypothetical protein [Flavobacteriales bacterium]